VDQPGAELNSGAAAPAWERAWIEALAEGEALAEDEAPAEGEALAEDEAPAEGEASADSASAADSAFVDDSAFPADFGFADDSRSSGSDWDDCRVLPADGCYYCFYCSIRSPIRCCSSPEA